MHISIIPRMNADVLKVWCGSTLGAWEFHENICRIVGPLARRMRDVAGEKGPKRSRVKASQRVCLCRTTSVVVWVLWDANEVARLFDNHRCPLFAQSGLLRLGVDMDGEELLHHPVAAAEWKAG